MSLCVYGRIEGRTFNEKPLETCLSQHFPGRYAIIQENSGRAVYEVKNNGRKTTVYNRLLIFEPEKEDTAVIFYGETIRFLRHLSQATKSRILATSDAPDEICLLDDRDIAWSANTALIEEIMIFFTPQDRAECGIIMRRNR